MELHSSQTPRFVIILDALIIAGVLSSTLYLFFNRLEFTRAAELESSRLELADFNARNQVTSPTQDNLYSLLPPPQQPDAAPVEKAADSIPLEDSNEQPEDTVKLLKPVKRAVKPQPPPAQSDVSANTSGNMSGGYKPRGYQPRGFQRRGFTPRGYTPR